MRNAAYFHQCDAQALQATFERSDDLQLGCDRFRCGFCPRCFGSPGRLSLLTCCSQPVFQLKLRCFNKKLRRHQNLNNAVVQFPGDA